MRCARLQLLLLLAICWAPAWSDLPVNCLHGQVLGRWTLHIGSPSVQTEPPHCGAQVPGAKVDPMLNPEDVVRAQRTYRVSLFDPAVAIGEDGAVGFWTMVYDEGFEIRIGGTTYFAFSAFRRSDEPAYNTPIASSDTAGFASDCNRTGAGWYRVSSHATVWGCYYAVRDGPVRRSEGAVEQPADVDSVPVRESSGEAQLAAAATAASTSARRSEVDAPAADDPPPPTALREAAEPGDESAEELASLASVLRRNVSKGFVRAKVDRRPEDVRYAGLPREWDWRNVSGVNFVPPVRTQGACGSCYAIAAVSMLEARLAIATGGRERMRLSVQDVLSCSPYSQGCEGGFPYIVGKYLRDYGVPSE